MMIGEGMLHYIARQTMYWGKSKYEKMISWKKNECVYEWSIDLNFSQKMDIMSQLYGVSSIKEE